MTLAGLRTYSGLVFIQNAFPLPLSGHSGMDLSPLLIGNYRSGTVRDSHPCSLLIGMMQNVVHVSEPMRVQNYTKIQNRKPKIRILLDCIFLSLKLSNFVLLKLRGC
jgi:hypothetical protein